MQSFHLCYQNVFLASPGETKLSTLLCWSKQTPTACWVLYINWMTTVYQNKSYMVSWSQTGHHLGGSPALLFKDFCKDLKLTGIDSSSWEDLCRRLQWLTPCCLTRLEGQEKLKPSVEVQQTTQEAESNLRSSFPILALSFTSAEKNAMQRLDC